MTWLLAAVLGSWIARGSKFSISDIDLCGGLYANRFRPCFTTKHSNHNFWSDHLHRISDYLDFYMEVLSARISVDSISVTVCGLDSFEGSILKFEPGFLPYSSINSSNVAFRAHVILHRSKMAIRDLHIFHPCTGCFCKI